ncbi:MAG TPA: YIP1 family protein [Thermoanaerobaculia bacterium]|nr:YIP1 family protein [Thermoanaerobaculia bacterium]
MSEAVAGSSPSEQEVGPLARIPGALFSPTTTFESIARRPTWLPPLLLWTALSLTVTFLLLPRVDYDRMIRASIEKRGQTLPEERIQSLVESQKKMAPILYGVFGAITPTLISLIVTLVFWGAFKAFGWDATFRQAFGATTHAFLPGVLGALVLLPVLANRETVDPRNLGDLLRSNLGFLVAPESKMLHSLAQSIDVFSILSLVLFVIGYSAAAKISRKAAAGVIVTLWAVYILAKSALAGVF